MHSGNLPEPVSLSRSSARSADGSSGDRYLPGHQPARRPLSELAVLSTSPGTTFENPIVWERSRNVEIRPILSALSRNKTRAVLIALQVALTLAVASNALSIIDQRLRKMSRDTGIDTENLE